MKFQQGQRVLDTQNGYGKVVYAPTTPNATWLKVELDNGRTITSFIDDVRAVETETE